MEKGFAFIDLETTGFGHKTLDRIVEIAVIETDENLQTISSWSTLINPLRDPGPVGVHGIKAEWLAEAPTFSDVALDLQARLNGKTMVVHNASFDVNFLKSEFRRLGVDENELSFEAICTLRLSRQLFPELSRYKLNWLAHELSLETSPDHSALADTQVTLELGRMLEQKFAAISADKRKVKPIRFYVHGLETQAFTIQRPSSDPQGNSNLLGVLAALPLNGQLPVEMHEYLELLDLFLLDDEISETEAENLLETARLHGLGLAEVNEAHSIYFTAMFEEALKDGVFTIEESNSLRAKAVLLGLSDLYNAMEEAWSEQASALPFGLTPGDSIVLTGDTFPPKELLTRQLEEMGLVVKSGVSKKTKLVAAADISSQSGKASSARALGIPVVSASELSSKLSAFNKR